MNEENAKTYDEEIRRRDNIRKAARSFMENHKKDLEEMHRKHDQHENISDDEFKSVRGFTEVMTSMNRLMARYMIFDAMMNLVDNYGITLDELEEHTKDFIQIGREAEHDAEQLFHTMTQMEKDNFTEEDVKKAYQSMMDTHNDKEDDEKVEEPNQDAAKFIDRFLNIVKEMDQESEEEGDEE